MDNEDELLGCGLVPVLQNNPDAQVLLTAYYGSQNKEDGAEEAKRVKNRLADEFEIDLGRIELKDGGKGKGWGIDIQVLPK
jgi:hypothetical protein